MNSGNPVADGVFHFFDGVVRMVSWNWSGTETTLWQVVAHVFG